MKHLPANKAATESQATRLSSRERLIWQAHQVFRQRGYYATSMAELGAACGMLKGSLYYHFAGKQDLMQEVLLSAYDLFKEQVFQLAYQQQMAPRQRLQAMLETTEQFYFTRKGGCLMASVGLEVGDRIPSFTVVIRRFLADWVEAFTHLLRTQYEAELADEKARAAVQEIQGALLLACINEDRQCFTTTCQRILAYLK